MKENLAKVSQRGKNLDSLYNNSENLSVQAKLFRRGVNRTRKRMCMEDLKMRACVIAGIIILLVSAAGAILITMKATG